MRSPPPPGRRAPRFARARGVVGITLRGRPRDGRRPGRRRGGRRADRGRGDGAEATAHEPGGPDGRLGPTLRWRAGNYRTPGVVAKVNLALARPAARSPGRRRARRGLLRGPDRPRAVDGRPRSRVQRRRSTAGCPRAPSMEATIPSLVDPIWSATSAAAAGVEHVMSVIVQYAPYRLPTARLGRAARRARRPGRSGTLETVRAGHRAARRRAPGPDAAWTSSVTYGLTGGHPLHGEPGLDQCFAWRPLLGWARYRMPLVGLYLAGSGAHPGGGVTGAAGRERRPRDPRRPPRGRTERPRRRARSRTWPPSELPRVDAGCTARRWSASIFVSDAVFAIAITLARDQLPGARRGTSTNGRASRRSSPGARDLAFALSFAVIATSSAPSVPDAFRHDPSASPVVSSG